MTQHHGVTNLALSSKERKIVDWSAPPDTAKLARPVTSKYRPVADALLARPGQWAQLDDRDTQSAAYQFALNVRRGRPAAFRPAGAFEAKHEGTSVWVRYVGSSEDQEPVELRFTEPPEPEIAAEPPVAPPVAPPDPGQAFRL